MTTAMLKPRYSKIRVHHPNRESLLKIRAGEFLYEDLVRQAEEKIALIEELFGGRGCRKCRILGRWQRCWRR
jgi:hypothetical protein